MGWVELSLSNTHIRHLNLRVAEQLALAKVEATKIFAGVYTC